MSALTSGRPIYREDGKTRHPLTKVQHVISKRKPVTDGQTHKCIIITVIAQPAELLYWHQNKYLNILKLKQLDTANETST
ncbi:hypothetical protein Pmani_030536 [Petrolisthes manimaculis]|uniref:Uncharacterized protein n=1 Tax=Petrolisthes manimaculis TaxID=1843537 RepID=A0AAE1TSS8_9EUCA|nr:hypothetical protein Pmani_030536 [Petrolisthes manimaculis]